MTRPKTITSDLRCPVCGALGKAAWEDDERRSGPKHNLFRRVLSVSHGFSIDLTNDGRTEPRIRCIHCDYVVPM